MSNNYWPELLATRIATGDFNFLGCGMRKPKNEVKFSHAEEIQQLHILYKDDSEYSVKNAYNIKVVKRKSGGFDIMYDYDFVVERNLPHGKERVESDKHVETTTGDVKAITLIGHRENGVRKTETIEFGGK